VFYPARQRTTEPLMELFPVRLKLPHGFTYHDNFITSDEERDLYESITKLDLHPLIFQGFEARRKVASFGYDYSFDKRSLSKGTEIPAAFQWLITKVSGQTSIPENAFAELLVTEYPIGSVINWHRDAPPFDVIAGISFFPIAPSNFVRMTRRNKIEKLLSLCL
jgi:alkylated DNA repair dioxygenase AlkB